MNKFLNFIVVLAAALSVSACKTTVQKPGKVDYRMEYSVGDVTFDMVKIPAGHYTMGLSADNRRKITNGIPHEVALDGFVISAKPVSQALWTAVMGGNPSSVQSPDAPVDMVSWVDAVKFIGKLNKVTGKIFILPTEAQWEYAQRLRNGKDFTSVAEWCLDSYDAVPEGAAGNEYFKPMELAVNPEGPAEKDGKVVRTVLERMEVESHTRRAKVGFRLAQPTEEVLTGSILDPIEGTTIDREKIDASDAKPEVFTVGEVTFKMVNVKGGSFSMGFNDYDAPLAAFSVPENEQPTHTVTVDDFAIGETEVTVALWNAVMGSVPYLNDIDDPKKPVRNVSWYNCQTFIGRLNALTGRKFRLPTEAEWEYAARGGQKSRHYGFSGSNAYDAMWFLDNAKSKPQDVKTCKANELGIYDMSGNVWEWCYDRAAEYSKDAQTCPIGATEGGTRILRGGSCASRWDACRISNRSFMPAKNIKGTFGLRLAL